MTKAPSVLLSATARLLEPDEREAVLGDLVEASEGPWESLGAVLGLAIRRQAALWRSGRAWLAAFGLAIPSSFLLMGFSVTVSRNYRQFAGPAISHATGLSLGSGVWLLLCNVVLLAGWAFAGGFVVGTLSRRTLWMSAALSAVPCLFCLERFRIESLSRFCLLLFLPAAVWGARRSLQIARVKLSSALILAITLTLLTIPTWTVKGAWIPNWALSWPAWYLVVTARKPWQLG